MPQMGTFEKTKANGRLAQTNKLLCRLLASTTQRLDGNIEAEKSDCMSDKDNKKQSQRVTGKLIVDNERILLHFQKSPANCDGATHSVNAEPTGNMDSIRCQNTGTTKGGTSGVQVRGQSTDPWAGPFLL
jgi:hypothetical protein